MNRNAGRRRRSLLGEMKGRNAASLFDEELPEEARPTAGNRALEVAMIWGGAVVDAGHFRAGGVAIGSSDGSHFQVYAEGVERHVLATVSGDGATVNAPPGGQVVIRRGGTEEKAGASASIGLADHARVEIGNVEFVLRFTRPAARMKSGFFENIDLSFTRVLSIALMSHAVLLAAMLVTPPAGEHLAEDLFRKRRGFTRPLFEAPEPREQLLDLSGLEESARPREDEGTFGKKVAEKKEADPSKEGAPTVDASKREDDRRKVLAAGLLGALGQDDGAASNVLGPGGIGTGINEALGGLRGGTGLGDAHGLGALGSRGAGPGGGGASLGLGTLGTKGSHRGRGGYGTLDLGGRGKATTRIIPGRTTVVGGLSKEVIGKVIRRHWNHIKYCYERELQKDPDLQGKVSVMFTIDGTGSVADASITEDSVGGGAVARCMTRRIRGWKFPPPQGGGQVIVTYPWVFRAAGG